MNKFCDYQKEMQEFSEHKIKKFQHIIEIDDFRDFLGFSEREMWGEFQDFDYENWIKEQ